MKKKQSVMSTSFHPREEPRYSEEYPGEYDEGSVPVEDRKTVSTAFILLFPALMIALMAVYYTPYLMIKVIVLALAVYQFLMVRKFISDYYKNR